MKRGLLLILLAAILFGTLFYFQHNRLSYSSLTESQESTPDADEGPVPTLSPATQQEIQNEPNNKDALGGYNVLIADRGNNRLVEVTPDKTIVWQYNFNLPKAGLGADDAFFADNGKTITVNLELYHVIQKIDYRTKKVVWSYGTPGKAGSGLNFLDRPDDAYKLPNGDIMSADIRNCRILEISPDKHIVRQYGKPGHCSNDNGYLDKPNGDTPLANGHVLISTIGGTTMIELDENWKRVFTMKLPLKYPSDPQLTKAGNILIADYSNPGKIIEITRQGNIVWEYYHESAPAKLNRPSLAIELPNGNILANDDLNHRVIVIDKQSKAIVWQYGVTAKPGNGPGQLSIPDGVDIIKRDKNTDISLTTTSVGHVSRHPLSFVNQTVQIAGYVLARENGYVIVSDEASGAINSHDLPVTGPGIDQMIPSRKYTMTGILRSNGLKSSNRNPYHLELTKAPF